ncbi:unnamed protein product [Closterium sp. NIES-54]
MVCARAHAAAPRHVDRQSGCSRAGESLLASTGFCCPHDNTMLALRFHPVHTALALPARGTDHGLIRPHYVRANPSHHGAATFSFIEYEDGTGETVVGRVHLLLTLMMNSEDAHPAGEAVAFVRQWYPSLEDECTGCMRMRPSDDGLSYDLVPVASVHRSVHMVESFVTPGLWYLNRWAGRCREELP